MGAGSDEYPVGKGTKVRMSLELPGMRGVPVTVGAVTIGGEKVTTGSVTIGAVTTGAVPLGETGSTVIT